MKIQYILFSILFLILSSCNHTEKWKQEIIQTEEDFEKMLHEKGLHDAFIAFADEEAVLKRGNKLIKGKEAIDSLYKNNDAKNLSWKVDVVEVSESGDLGFTYGAYSIAYVDSIGNPLTDVGIFNTIWKRQEDGSWKYVVD
jgi:ketosteroid isomerase-like protein